MKGMHIMSAKGKSNIMQKSNVYYAKGQHTMRFKSNARVRTSISIALLVLSKDASHQL